MIAPRGSRGSDHAATGAGPSIVNFCWRTRTPTIALMTDLVIDQPIRGVSTLKPGITLGDDPTIAYNDDRLRLAVRRAAGSLKAWFASRLEGRIAWFDEVWPGDWRLVAGENGGSGAQDKCSIGRSKDAGRLVR